MRDGKRLAKIQRGRSLSDTAWSLLIVGTAVAVFGRAQTWLVLVGVVLWGIGIGVQIAASIYTLSVKARTHQSIELGWVLEEEPWPRPDFRERKLEAPRPSRYYRSLHGDTWHFCRNCRTAPQSEYEIYIGTSPPGDRCNECLWLAERDLCTQVES